MYVGALANHGGYTNAPSLSCQVQVSVVRRVSVLRIDADVLGASSIVERCPRTWDRGLAYRRSASDSWSARLRMVLTREAAQHTPDLDLAVSRSGSARTRRRAATEHGHRRAAVRQAETAGVLARTLETRSACAHLGYTANGVVRSLACGCCSVHSRWLAQIAYHATLVQPSRRSSLLDGAGLVHEYRRAGSKAARGCTADLARTAAAMAVAVQTERSNGY